MLASIWTTIGNFFSTLSSFTQVWLLRYRATVLDSSSPPLIKVKFVDYGTEVTVHQDFLRRNIIFQDVPALAFPVRLNVKPKFTKWEKMELDFIHENAVDKVGQFEVLQPSPESWLVSLDLPGVTDFAHFLVQNGFCKEGDKLEESHCNCMEILKSSHYLPRFGVSGS